MDFFVSVTRLRLKKKRKLPAFLWFSLRSLLQARNSRGNMDVQTFKDRGLAFWTMSIWRSEEDLHKFRNAGSHAKVMPKMARWCDEAAFVHWHQGSMTPPTWTEAWQRLAKEGTVSRVDHPSSDHLAGKIRRPRLK